MMHDEDNNPRRGFEPALNPLPPLVWALALPIIVLELAFALAGAGLIGGAQGIGWRLMTLQRMVFAPEVLIWIAQTGSWTSEQMARIVTYPFVHVSAMHALFVVAFILALGKFVGEVLRPVAILVVFLGSSIGAALVYTALGQTVPLAGGYPGVFGLVGAFTLLLWADLRAKGGNPARAFLLIGTGPDWMADLAGFVFGFCLALLLSPRLRHLVRERLRAR